MSTTILGNILIFLSAIEALTFVAAYHWFSKGNWRGDAMSRHVMAFVAADAAVLTLSCVRVIGGASLDTGWFAILRVVVFLGVPWVLGWRLWILVKLYRKRRTGASATNAEDSG